MYYKIKVINNISIDFSITIMLRQSRAESAGHFWWTVEFENMANPDFGNLKHLQNLGHFSLTADSRSKMESYQSYHISLG